MWSFIGLCLVLLQDIIKWGCINTVRLMVEESVHNAVLCPVPYIISDMSPLACVTLSLTAVNTTRPTHTHNTLSHTSPCAEKQVCFFPPLTASHAYFRNDVHCKWANEKKKTDLHMQYRIFMVRPNLLCTSIMNHQAMRIWFSGPIE